MGVGAARGVDSRVAASEALMSAAHAHARQVCATVPDTSRPPESTKHNRILSDTTPSVAAFTLHVHTRTTLPPDGDVS